MGKSGSTKAGNPIGSDPSRVDYWANNDFWYDDVSDGPVTAQVTLPDGSKRDIDDPKNTAWVIVSPPKYAPAIQPIITLYDVIRDAAVKGKWIKDYADVAYYRDIYPVLCRAADTAWVNQESQRGHGYDKGGDFRLQLKALATPDDSNKRRREFIVKMLRDPLATGDKAEEQATAHFMPPMSGDADQRTNGDFNSWLSLLPSQYRRFEAFKAGKYGPGSEPAYPPLQKMSARRAGGSFAARRARALHRRRVFSGDRSLLAARQKGNLRRSVPHQGESRGRHQVHVPSVAGGFVRLQGQLVAGGASG